MGLIAKIWLMESERLKASLPHCHMPRVLSLMTVAANYWNLFTFSFERKFSIDFLLAQQEAWIVGLTVLSLPQIKNVKFYKICLYIYICVCASHRIMWFGYEIATTSGCKRNSRKWLQIVLGRFMYTLLGAYGDLFITYIWAWEKNVGGSESILH